MRHMVTVMRPTQAQGTRGEPQGKDAVIVKDVPCSIETLSGREGELARQIFAAATYRVQMYGDPSKPIENTDYLQFGSRRLNIGFINDRQQNGIELELLCEEALS